MKRMKTDITVTTRSNFNRKCKGSNWIRENVLDSKVNNNKLDKLKRRAQDIYDNLIERGIVTPQMIIDRIKNPSLHKDNINDPSLKSFISFVKAHIEKCWNKGMIETHKKYTTFLHKLEGYMVKKGKEDICFKDLTYGFVDDFYTYLCELPNERQPHKIISPNTSELYMNKFKALVNEAVKHRYIDKRDDPFLRFKYSGIPTKKEGLNREELQSLWTLNLTPGTRIWDARNIFFFSLFLGGMRISDVLQMKWTDITTDGRLYYGMGKSDKVKDLKLVQEAINILKLYEPRPHRRTDYIFPFLDNHAEYATANDYFEREALTPEIKAKLKKDISYKTSIVNNNLAKLRKRAGIEKPLTTHINRHTFGKRANEINANPHTLQNIFSHSNLSITEGYMGHFKNDDTDKVLETMFTQDFLEQNTQGSAAVNFSDLKTSLEKIPFDKQKEILAKMQDLLNEF